MIGVMLSQCIRRSTLNQRIHGMPLIMLIRRDVHINEETAEPNENLET